MTEQTTSHKKASMPLEDQFFQLMESIHRGENRLTELLEFPYSEAVFRDLPQNSLPLSDSSFLEVFTHRSFLHEKIQEGSGLKSYERLEFFGDAVLELVFASLCFESFPGATEGELSKLRSAHVNEAALTELSDVLALGKWCLLGKGEWHQEGRNRSKLKSDLFEALVGLVFRELGYNKARDFIDQVLELYLNQEERPFLRKDRLIQFDDKSRLQEIFMAEFGQLPKYRSKELEQGYQVDLYLGKTLIVSEKSKSKKQAEKNCAKKILKEELWKGIKNAH